MKALLMVGTAVVLIFTVGGAVQWWLWKYVPPPAVIQARLQQDGGRRAPGACTTNALCDGGTRCVLDGPRQDWFCLPAECQTDDDCEAGHRCQLLTTLDGQPGVRRCTLVGVRQEGQSCEDAPRTPTGGCSEGLVCAESYCRRRCHPQAQPTCPEGYVCARDYEAGFCRPDCQKLGCPSGQQCIRLFDNAWRCGVLVGEDCDRTGCSRPKVCEGSWSGEVFEKICRIPCRIRAHCPEDSFCADPGFCTPRCDPERPESCPPRHRCELFSPKEGLYGCVWSGELAEESLKKGATP